jgi:hypothetical protein
VVARGDHRPDGFCGSAQLPILASPLAAEGLAIADPTTGDQSGTYGAQIGSNGDGFLAIYGAE